MHEKVKELLSKATQGPISFKDAEIVFENIMDGNLSDVEISSFLTSLKVRGESIDELTAAASIMRKKSLKVLNGEIDEFLEKSLYQILKPTQHQAQALGSIMQY